MHNIINYDYDINKIKYFYITFTINNFLYIQDSIIINFKTN